MHLHHSTIEFWKGMEENKRVENTLGELHEILKVLKTCYPSNQDISKLFIFTDSKVTVQAINAVTRNNTNSITLNIWNSWLGFKTSGTMTYLSDFRHILDKVSYFLAMLNLMMLNSLFILGFNNFCMLFPMGQLLISTPSNLVWLNECFVASRGLI